VLTVSFSACTGVGLAEDQPREHDNAHDPHPHDHAATVTTRPDPDNGPYYLGCERSALRSDQPVTPLAADAGPFTFGGATPHAVLDVVNQRIFKALGSYRALDARTLCDFDTSAIRRKERSGFSRATPPLEHPRILVRGFFHSHLSFNDSHADLIPRATASAAKTSRTSSLSALLEVLDVTDEPSMALFVRCQH